MKFFVSHAVMDKKLIESFVDLLQSGMNINFNDIYCTSNGNLQTGQLFIEEIRHNLILSDVVVFLFSKNFFESKFCMCELGAAWVQGKYIVPILVPPKNFNDLENTPLKGLQARNITIEKDMNEIFNEFVRLGVIQDMNVNRFNTKLQEFMRKKPWINQLPGYSLESPLKATLEGFAKKDTTRNMIQGKLPFKNK